MVTKDGLVAGATSGPVQNGSVFELGSVSIGTHLRRVVVPAGATVVRGSPSRHIYVATKKTLAFKGHPPDRMPLVALRTNMGCASKREGTLTLYAVFTRPMMDALVGLFSRKYPFVKTQFMREGRGDALADR